MESRTKKRRFAEQRIIAALKEPGAKENVYDVDCR
jgi:hypothetical protein